MISKNDILEAYVTDLTVNGDGVAKTDNYPVFIAGAVVGDFVRFKVTKTNKTYGFGKLLEIITPSKNRRTSPCPSFCDCGGCSLMHTNYDAQLKLKSDFVLSNLVRIGGCSPDEFTYEPIVGADNEFNYRNKAQFPVGISKGEVVSGFYSPKSHDIVPCKTCLIQDQRINKAIELGMAYIKSQKISVYDERTHKGIIRHIYVRCGKDELMLVFVTNSKKPLKNIDNLSKKLSELGKITIVQNINTKRTNVILGRENIVFCGDGYIKMSVDDLVFKVSPHSFFQVNTEQMKKLYNKALEYASLSKDDTVFDLYCGVGSISLYMARSAKSVTGVEIVPDAIDNAKENAHLNGITNAEFYCGDCTEVVESLLSDGKKCTVAVVDPPRKGCDEKLLSLLKTINPERIVYVSCNSATLARDVAILKDFGYTLKKVCAVDLFPQSTHVETVVMLSQLKPDDVVQVELNAEDLALTSAEAKATYEEIKTYVKRAFGFKVSSLYIAQVKQKMGLPMGKNYNISKKGTRVPICPPEKEEAILEALRHFKMIK